MRHLPYAALVAIGLFGVSACGGGSSSDSGASTSADPRPQTAAPSVTVLRTAQPYAPEPGALAQIGVQLNSDSVQERAQIVQTTGLFNPTGPMVKITDGSVFFEDPDGAPGSTNLLEDVSVTSERKIRAMPSAPASILVFTGFDNLGGGSGNAVIYGMIGDAPDPSQFSNDTVIYTGDAEARWRSPSDGQSSFEFFDGRSVANANFGTGRVDVEMDRFTQQGNAPFDQISIENMQINGARFEGGLVTTSLNGSRVNSVGANAQSSSAGFFAGPVTGGIPAEIGGIGYVRGDAGSVFGAFVGRN